MLCRQICRYALRQPCVEYNSRCADRYVRHVLLLGSLVWNIIHAVQMEAVPRGPRNEDQDLIQLGIYLRTFSLMDQISAL